MLGRWVNERMSNLYLKLVGRLTAATVGRMDRYSAEHQSFLASGYVCPGCKQTLMRWWGAADVTPLTPNGQPVPLLLARAKATQWQCPKCHHKWKFRLP